MTGHCSNCYETGGCECSSMTTESQRAFEEWFKKEQKHWLDVEVAYEAWQASEARIRTMLESEAMVNIVDTEIQATLFQTHGYCSSKDMAEAAKAALKAIVEGLC